MFNDAIIIFFVCDAVLKFYSLNGHCIKWVQRKEMVRETQIKSYKKNVRKF